MKLYRNEEAKKLPQGKLTQQEKVLFRDLDYKQKLAYIWGYYKGLIIGLSIAIFLAAVTVPTIIINHQPMILYTVFLNSRLLGQADTDIKEQFLEYAGIEKGRRQLVLNTAMSIHHHSAVPSPATATSVQALASLFATRTVDVIVCDVNNFAFYVERDVFMDLEPYIPPEWSDYKVTARDAQGNTGVFGLSLERSQILLDENAFSEPPIFTIVANAQNMETAVEFMFFLMSEWTEVEEEEEE